MKREKFKSRLGFLLLSAGCAIGIGNVWRFPYVVGQHGGGLFVLLYILFLVTVGVPVLTMEFAIGRASRKSSVKAYGVLEPKGSKWHIHGNIGMIGNYILMAFYTSVAGWMLYYFYRFATGELEGLEPEGVSNAFSNMLNQPATMTFWMVVIVILGFWICSAGLQKGVERITKWMMSALLVIMIMLAVNSMFLPGGVEGIKFYLVPDLTQIQGASASETVKNVLGMLSAAINQSFFTLSLGIGSMLIFGSYLDKERTLLGESMNIAMLDTFVAFVSGLIIFPACISYNVPVNSGPPLIFITLPNVFNNMTGGRLWGSLFFLFMSFAAFSTILAVFENLMACCMDLWGWTRKRAAFINVFVVIAISIPCVLGFNLLSGFTPRGPGSCVLDLEDFIVSNVLLPGGSLIYLLFCVSRVGWGFKKIPG
ncbi:sodium:neurotransmitter symporter family protein [gut metagenome]|uniref:Sodium:neurotransmitter symporter family protein n=1 Tax=gut metagenome TaxID=749906 RepID=J9GC84_9ZZZZ